MSPSVEQRATPNRRPTVSVGIAAWNAEANIGAILRALCSQREDRVQISEIIVHSDQSTDGTVHVARQFPASRIRIIESAERRGFAGSFGTLLKAFTGDALILLNDDIRIRDDRFVETMAAAIFEDSADFVGANLQPLPPRTFVEQASVSIFRVWERIRGALPDPNNIHTCDGAALGLSGRFANSVLLPADLGLAGNMDAFLYFSCVASGFRYLFARSAVVYYRSPASLRDYVARNARNDSQKSLLGGQFGAAVTHAYRIPPALYWKSVGREIRNHPLVAAFVLLASILVRGTRRYRRRRTATWEMLQSSKQLD
jgi:glycosyltransferase involved in cell wall biosynthesis